MKTKSITAVLAALFLLGAAHLQSQAQQPVKSALASLQAIKTTNQEIIDKQQKTLQGLDDMQKTVEQIKLMGKRS